MYCGQCGKKVMDYMLFCPFCGSPIVIPEQDEPQPAAPAAAEQPAVPQPEPQPVPEAEAEPEAEIAFESAEDSRPISIFDLPVDLDDDDLPASDIQDVEAEEDEGGEDGFVPLSFELLAEEAEEIPMPEIEGDPFFFMVDEDAEIMDVEEDFTLPAPDDDSDDDSDDADEAGTKAEPVREAAPPRRPVRPAVPEFRRQANTYIPVKEIDPEDMFMDGPSEDPYDDEDDDEYDARPARPARRRFREDDDSDFDYEEPEQGTFFQRHIRGIVGLILLLILVLICLIWAVSPKGQISLAKMNLAWTADPYADLGYEAYQQNSDLMAARYYEKAYSHDPENYEYAHSAMVAYYEADRIESAATMLKKCIEMQPDNPEPYQEMLILYPDAAARPWEISELVRLGYQRTGDESLNIG